MLEQSFGVRAVDREETDADARTDVDLDPVDHERLRQGSPDLARDLFGCRGRDLAEQDQELVTTLTCDDIVGPHGCLQPRPDGLEQFVSRRMAEAVVDQLEVVEIDEEEGDAGAGSRGSLQAQLQVIEERRSVRETGQRVMQRRVCELLSRFGLDALALADVGDDAAHE